MRQHNLASIYAITLILSAALLFSVQPMFSKMILPLLGGSAQVWTTAMLFFQLCLLAGYGWAHLTGRLGIRLQAGMHMALFLFFIAVLPLSIPSDWIPPAAGNPALWQLSVMALRLGGPFFVLAALAPMLQHWFAQTNHHHANNPYFLYAASNFGSMTSLIAYPVLIEPLLTLAQQSLFWSAGYGILLLLIVCCVVMAASHLKKDNEEKNQTMFLPPLSWRRRFEWMLLAFIPSSLMLGATTHMTTDVASVPLLWVLPLALYLATFVIAFARRQWLGLEKIWLYQGIALLYVLIVPVSAFPAFTYNITLLIGAHLFLFFFTALGCHALLARCRPPAARLTEYYLLISLGGALGGIFNALAAPILFVTPLEYPLVLGASLLLRYAAMQASHNKILHDMAARLRQKKLDAIFTFPAIALFLILFLTTAALTATGAYERYITAAGLALLMILLLDRRWSFAAAATIIMLFFTPGHNLTHNDYSEILLRERNFFGVLKVVDAENDTRFLLHGTTNHGVQSKIDKYKLTPIAYYSKASPLQDAIAFMDRRQGAQDFAVIGLGVGVTACFQKAGRHYDFYEIDPAVVKIAEDPQLFTYLKDCGSPYKVILGDGRMKIAAAPDRHYDLILVDVYSSDNIPVHMITKEAVEIYLSKLKENGILLFNISNKYLDIEPVLTDIAAALEVKGLAHISDGGTVEDSTLEYYSTHYFAITPSWQAQAALMAAGWTAGLGRGHAGIWSDQYSNIIGVLGNESAVKRAKTIGEKNRAATSSPEN